MYKGDSELERGEKNRGGGGSCINIHAHTCSSRSHLVINRRRQTERERRGKLIDRK